VTDNAILIEGLEDKKRQEQISFAVMAAELGYSKDYLWRIIKGHQAPGLDLLLNLIDRFGDLVLARGDVRYILRHALPHDQLPNNVDRSLGCVCLANMEEDREAAEAIQQRLTEALNALQRGEGLDLLIDLCEQVVCDRIVAARLAEEGFKEINPEVVRLAWKQHRSKLVQRGYVRPFTVIQGAKAR